MLVLAARSCALRRVSASVQRRLSFPPNQFFAHPSSPSSILLNSSASPRRFASSSSSSSGHNQQSQPPAEQPPQSWYQRGKAKIKRYGKVGLATYVAVDLVSLAGLTLIIHNGLDLVPLLDAFHITHDKFPNLGDSIVSAWLVALACNKLTVPLRLPIAVAITPRVHEWWTGEPRHPPSSK